MDRVWEIKSRAGKIAQCLRTLDALQGDWLPFPAPTSSLIIFCNTSSRGSSALFWPLLATNTYLIHSYTCNENIHTHKIQNILNYFSKDEVISFLPNTTHPQNPVHLSNQAVTIRYNFSSLAIATKISMNPFINQLNYQTIIIKARNCTGIWLSW